MTHWTWAFRLWTTVQTQKSRFAICPLKNNGVDFDSLFRQDCSHQHKHPAEGTGAELKKRKSKLKSSETHHYMPCQLALSIRSNVKWLCCSNSSLQPKHCNWLHPEGTPGSNTLMKLICEILTMWLFRCLVIWYERSLTGWIPESWHLFQQKVAENYCCRVILRESNYKWQCLSFSSWNPISFIVFCNFF